MSRKYNEKIVQGSGYSTIKFQCDYGLKILEKMGWTEGKGLGVQENGRQECVQVRRREDNLGLGTQTVTGEFKWNNNWWETKFNTAIQGLQIENGSTSESEEDEEDHENHPKFLKNEKS